jgi:hypothetical protein
MEQTSMTDMLKKSLCMGTTSDFVSAFVLRGGVVTTE